VLIRDATPDDGAHLATIYNPYVTSTVITFEELPVSADEMGDRVAAVRGAGLPWLVAVADGVILGYAYAGPWRSRAAYRHSVESAVYVRESAAGRGVGTALYGHLFERLRTHGIHAVMAGIALPNDASVALHEKLGMVKVAHFSEVGFKLGRWVDVAYWQLVL
jgi:phosphinothricin acetyltransferase